MSDIRALIFDFDGVIVDTEPLHYEGFLRVMKRFNYFMTYEYFEKHYLGFKDRDCFIGLLNEIGIKYNDELINELVEEKGRWLIPLLSELPIKIKGNTSSDSAILTFDGLTDFIKAASGMYRLAVASGALRDEIEVILKRLEIYNYFEFIVAAGEYERGKPDPEPYILAYKRLSSKYSNIKISECVGIEDSFFGVESVKSAGMKCVAVTNSYSQDVLYKYGADMVVDRLRDKLLPFRF